MINIKSNEEIAVMTEGGKILSHTINSVLAKLQPGASLKELDQLAEKEILLNGAEPAFKRVPGYKWTICASVNDVVVHGIPDNYIIKEGDVVGIDCGVYYKGFNTDSAWTVKVGNEDNGIIDKFLITGQETLKKATAKAIPGNYIYDISQEIQANIESNHYSVVKNLVGHGVGRDLHEDPEIPGFVALSREQTPKIEEGMVLAVEIIYNIGSPDIKYRPNDEWTIVTKDGKISGLFEATVAATIHGCVVLTEFYGASRNN